MKRIALVTALMVAMTTGAAYAKLPPPSEEAKAKADELKAKAAYGTKVAVYKLCLTQNKVAERHVREQKAKGIAMKPADTAACQDPGPFVAPAAAPAPAVKTVAAPAKK